MRCSERATAVVAMQVVLVLGEFHKAIIGGEAILV